MTKLIFRRSKRLKTASSAVQPGAMDMWVKMNLHLQREFNLKCQKGESFYEHKPPPDDDADTESSHSDTTSESED